ncbi:EFR1 family ferrodoxin [Bittarella massiliensis (ex Durand et al. 2017)]|uniref:Ferredoxin n=1 Tax=Bittarella massiliensis (ex Durand et al. 2017) TaxID=1720313 RepID=A0AAW5KI65_9FIRM|nr:EFR1 family ferrodoxin [Bittarella massiliensis (ex Durand et al. 2017)]MCQ4950394.1 EFR1 family ferrodoxin [Bittarella massiliensis (ex Durand et al. 2017)]
MILYFSGTGNSEYVAQKLGRAIDDEVLNLFEAIRSDDFSELRSQRPWVVVAPTYAWRIPRLLQRWLERTRLAGSADLYFAMTCGGSIGNAGQYLAELCAQKGMNYRGCMEIAMPENYLALFTTPTREEALRAIEKADRVIESAARLLKGGEDLPASEVSFGDRVNSGLVNRLFYPLFVRAKKFYATDDCISCGRCVDVCPLGNVRLAGGKPVWWDRCTHCMACICRCPKEAIEYGRHSRGLPRYTCPKRAQ